MKQIFALVDCNNFYVSCEQVFNPSLRNKPVVVLSNNDGCVISRSQEAKDLGIKMGQPFFEIETFAENHNVIPLSANFTLYGNMSRRVMETLLSISPEVEVYSIDEAFISLEGLPIDNYKKYGLFVKNKVYKWTGIPVSVGIAPTKTLAKIATYIAKHEKGDGVTYISPDEELAKYLKKVPIEEVWGIGRSYAQLLQSKGIETAYDFTLLSEKWVKKYMKITGLRTFLELKGISAIPMEKKEERKSIITSRTFGKAVESYVDLWSAISTFISMSAERLREEGYLASGVSVFLSAGYYTPSSYFAQESEILTHPTDFTPELLDTARRILQRIFVQGKKYKKAGIMLSGLVNKRNYQYEIFTPVEVVRKREKLMKAVDEINSRFGRNSITFASGNLSTRWRSIQKRLSQKFTTSWQEIPVVKK